MAYFYKLPLIYNSLFNESIDVVDACQFCTSSSGMLILKMALRTDLTAFLELNLLLLILVILSFMCEEKFRRNLLHPITLDIIHLNLIHANCLVFFINNSLLHQKMFDTSGSECCLVKTLLRKTRWEKS